MAKIALYNQQGEKTGDIQVSDAMFGIEFNGDLVHQALVRQLANARVSEITHTKTKAEVRGGGRKPYAQKGTGQARQGSIRNPHWKGGGVAFGPRNNRNYTQMMPKKQRRLAIFSALSEKLKNGKIIAIDKYETQELKTKNFMQMLHKLPIEKDVLILIPEKNNTVQKASANLPFAKTMLVNYLNIRDLQRFDQILFFEAALKKMEEVFGTPSKAKVPKKKSESKASSKSPKVAKK